MKPLLGIAVLAGFIWASPASSAVLGPQSIPAFATEGALPIEQVKAKKKAKKVKARPYGWSKGRKVGWRGGSVPPGLRKRH